MGLVKLPTKLKEFIRSSEIFRKPLLLVDNFSLNLAESSIPNNLNGS